MTNEETLNHILAGMAESRAIHLETNRALSFEVDKLRAALGAAQKELIALRAAASAAAPEALTPIEGVMPEHFPEF